jgi:hypothetical protein
VATGLPVPAAPLRDSAGLTPDFAGLAAAQARGLGSWAIYKRNQATVKTD